MNKHNKTKAESDTENKTGGCQREEDLGKFGDE